VSVITIIGNLLSENPAVTSQVFTALDGLPLLAVSLGPSSSSLSIVLPDQQASVALRLLHALVV
jgi:aspartokinase